MSFTLLYLEELRADTRAVAEAESSSTSTFRSPFVIFFSHWQACSPVNNELPVASFPYVYCLCALLFSRRVRSVSKRIPTRRSQPTHIGRSHASPRTTYTTSSQMSAHPTESIHRHIYLIRKRLMRPRSACYVRYGPLTCVVEIAMDLRQRV